jgi:4-carboxymuconolactone decarboxylase
MARIDPIDPDQMTARQREIYETIASGPRGGVRGPLAVWLHCPALAEQAQALGRYCRYETSLPPRLSELAILVTASVWNSEFEWQAHEPIALKAGVSHEIAAAIRSRSEPHFERTDEAVVYRFAKELHTARKISDALYAEAVSLLGQEGVLDLVGILGYYTLISMTINVFEVAAPNATPSD